MSLLICIIFSNKRNISMLRPFLCIPYSNHNYLKRNINEISLPFPTVGAIRMNFKYQIVKVWLDVPQFGKCQ